MSEVSSSRDLIGPSDLAVPTRQRMPRLVKNEWIALTLFSLHMMLGLFWVELVRAWWIIVLFPAVLLWLFTVLLIIPTIGDARDEESGRRKARTLLAIPLAITGALILSNMLWLPQRLAASVYLARHQRDMDLAVANAGLRPAAAILYLHGVPDGGLIIVRAKDGRPEQLTHSNIPELTGEQIQSCDRIIGGWLCGFD